MTVRFVLLCAGTTASARSGTFPDPDESLDSGGRARVARMGLDGLAPQRCLTSPARVARETAAALGLTATPEPLLGDRDHGEWTGLPLEAIDAQALLDWIAAPEHAPPGGESMAAVAARIRPLLDAAAAEQGTLLAITHAAVIRAFLAEALGLPVAATLAIDIAPLSRTLLSFHGRWRLQELRRGS